MAIALAPAVDARFTEPYRTPDGRTVRIHAAEVCRGPCPVHMPTAHPLRSLPLHWDAEHARFERVCEHGIRHPDPDLVTVARRTGGADAARAASMHVCDGCCGC